MTDFQMVSFIPKTAFSSLLVLGFLDMMDSWFIKSYYRTKVSHSFLSVSGIVSFRPCHSLSLQEKAEWLVVPLIVILAFVLGLLQSVFVGLAMSTLIFVAAFFRSGVVKYIANGLSVRSTIERPPKSADWLDANGELIQILVLQNYLFFGNASSILAYISSMFDSPDQSIDPLFVPPMPKYVILDLTLVTGMDTSSVDVFSDIKALCENHECKLFLAGTSRDLMKTMSLSGFKADTAKERSRRQLRFFSDLDAAVGKTEDMLLQTEGFEEQISHPSFGGTRGFEHALEHIDEQHVLDFAKDLKGLTKYTKRVRLEAGQILYEDVQVDRGIFFVEHGIVKIERDADETLTRKGSSDTFSRSATNSWGSLNRLNARSSEVVQAIARMKYAVGNGNWQQPSFRVARVGPGWILGANEALSQSAAPGVTIAGKSFLFVRCIMVYDLAYILNCPLHSVGMRTPFPFLCYFERS
jgi:CRP-like cAMP-binding protein